MDVGEERGLALVSEAWGASVEEEAGPCEPRAQQRYQKMALGSVDVWGVKPGDDLQPEVVARKMGKAVAFLR